MVQTRLYSVYDYEKSHWNYFRSAIAPMWNERAIKDAQHSKRLVAWQEIGLRLPPDAVYDGSGPKPMGLACRTDSDFDIIPSDEAKTSETRIFILLLLAVQVFIRGGF
jgi:hypothetical protein